MDPWAEADWLQRFKSLAAGLTVLSSRSLIAAGGRYAGSWRRSYSPSL